MTITTNTSTTQAVTRYLMNPVTGSVDTEQAWRQDYTESTPETWGGSSFEDAGLVEVTMTEEGEWTEADSDADDDERSRTYCIPEFVVCYLEYGYDDTMTEEEENAVNDWIAAEGIHTNMGAWEFSDDRYFSHVNDIYGFMGATCVDATFTRFHNC